jgi:hypothetical protein
VNDKILESIQIVMQGARRELKTKILYEQKTDLKKLSSVSRAQVGTFIDRIQMKCPRMTQQDLSHAVEILTKMELTRTGYGLLQKLSALSPDDIDGLHKILDEWSVADAREVLDELHWRLEIVKKMTLLVENPRAKELQELQPLFERGLWIFGPEYESVEYMANKSLSTIVEKFFKGKGIELKSPSKRPDFVALPESSIAIYSADDYENGEVSGIRKILIIELKRGGSFIGIDEKRQAQDYAIEIRNSGRISPKTEIVCFVLGANIKKGAGEESTEGDYIRVIPRTYNIVLRQANARTFNLIQKIKQAKDIQDSDDADPEIKEVLAQSDLLSF